MKRDGWFSALQNLTWLTQLGLSLAAPPLLCLFGAGWLAQKFSLGPWVWAVAILLGLGAAACLAWGNPTLLVTALWLTAGAVKSA